MKTTKTKLWLLISLLISGCAGLAEFEGKFKTWQEIREGNVVMQGQDFSCGAAALATMLNYFFE